MNKYLIKKNKHMKKFTILIKRIFVLVAFLALTANSSVWGQACDYFTAANSTTVTGWTEQVGDWSIYNNTLQPPATAVWNYITRDGSTQTNGCVTLRATYTGTSEVKYIGAVGRYSSPTTYLMAKIQDNSSSGYWDSYYIYENESIIANASGLNFGTDVNIALEYNGTAVSMKIDIDLNGTWDYTYTATSTTTNAGLCGVGAYNLATVDNWCYGSTCITCAPPANETCAGATYISGYSTPYNTTGVLGCTDDCSGQGYYDVFYYFTPPVTGSYTADMYLSTGDTYMRLWSGSCCGTLETYNDDGAGDMDPLITWTLIGGVTYYFELGSWSSSGMQNSPYNFNLVRNCSAPANETCAGATSISYAQIAAGFSTSGTLGCTDDCSGQAYNDVFYRYDCTCTGSYTFDMGYSDGDTYMRIFSGSCCGTVLAYNDDSFGDMDPTITTTLTSGTSYWIECGSYSSSEYMKGAAYNLNISTTCSITPPCGNTDLGTIYPSTCYPQDANYTAGTIPFWSFTATAGMTYNFSLGGSSEDSYLHLYNSAFTEVASNDDNGPFYSGVPSSVSYTCTVSGTYYITACHYVCTAFSNSGYLTYWSSYAPYGNSSLQTIYPTTLWQNQAYASGTLNVYRFSANAGSMYDFSLCSNSEDSYIRIYNSTYDLQFSNDDNGPWCSGLPSSVSWTAPLTADYIVEISHLGCNGFTNSGDLAYRLSCSAPAEPTAVSATPATICTAGTSNLNATSAGNNINWYTVSSGGTSIGSSSSGANFPVSPTTTTTYYAESQTLVGGTVAMPAEESTFTSMARGYWFTAPVGFTITGLNCLASGTTQNLAVVRLNVTPPTFGTTTNDFTTLYLTQGNTNTGVIPVFIPVNTGDIIGILGTRDAAENNSYGANPSTVTILGQSVSLARFGMQYALSTTSPQEVWTESGTGIGRIEMVVGTGGSCTSLSRTPTTVTVVAEPTISAASATPASICAGASSNLTATSVGNTINWYTVSTGGTPIGSSASGANYAVSPATTTTYYAEAQSTGGGTGSQTFSYTGTIETFTVPAGVTSLTITAIGATGGKASAWTPAGGKGASMTGTFSVTPGDVLKVLVGGAGADGIVASTFGSGGGGGGSFVTTNTDTPLIIAGGGGGVACHDNTFVPIGADAVTTTSGVNGNSALGNTPANYGVGGVGGYGATQAGGGACAGNAGGLLGNGVANTSCCTTTWAYGFVNGGAGGAACHSTSGLGGFGGGGGGGHTGGGGGGGYSGGGASWDEPTNGGGGGSYNAGTSQINTAGYNASGNGQVNITWGAASGCVSSTRTPVTVTIIPDNTITLVAGGTQTNCINTAITTTTYATTGATGATVTGLPAGVTGSWASNVVTITGTPTASGIFTYTIALPGGCGVSTATGTITVTPNNTVSVASSTPTLCINSALTDITHTTSGATGIGTATGLPAGVTATWASNTITISGTPTASGTFNYNIHLTGGCGTVNATGTITVTPNNTVSVASSTPTLCINSALTDITHTTSGATGIGTATGLPAGVTASWASNTITISGTPTVSGTFNYNIPLTGGCGTENATGTITVTPNNTVSVASSTPTLCSNSALTAITHTTTGATGIGAATGLPAGVTASWASNTITISGTPTASGTFNYNIPLTGGCGTANATGTITVTPNNTVSVASSTPTLCINSALTAITHTTSGATGIGTATGLPAGVTASWASNTITISGTPTASGTFNYNIPLTGGCGTENASGTITVTPNNTVSVASSTPTLCINSALTDITHTTSGATGIGTATGLPAGVTASWASNTITISGTPTVSGTFNYNIPLTGGCGTANASGTITVTSNNTVSVASSTPTLCINSALTAVTHTTSGATGIGTATGLPAGVTASWASNTITISGTPTVSGTFNYSIPLTGGCGTANASGTITVTPDNTLTLSSAAGTDAQNVCINAPITNITYASTVATGAIVSGLPLGVTGNWSSNVVTISGTPTVTGAYTYTVTTTGGCATATTTGTLVVNVNMIADVSVQAFDNPACSHTIVNFTATPVNGGLAPAYQWYVDGIPVGGNSSTYSSNSINNGFDVVCQLTSNEFCAINNPAYDTVNMVISSIPITEAGNTAVFTGTPVQIGDPNNGPGTISWSPAAGLSNNWIAQPLASPSVTTTYTLTIDNYGCVRTDTVTVYFGGLGHVISGKTRYLKRGTSGNPSPNPPTYNAVIYNIDNVEVKLKTNPGGLVQATTMSDANGVYQFTNVPDGNYILSYDHIPYDSMQYVNQVNAVDLALLKYLIGHDTLTDPSRNFTAKHKKAANVDNNTTINTVDIARISAKVGLPYTPARNFPKGNWVALDTSVTVAGADLTVTLQTVAYGDYDASSTRYKDSLTNWGTAKVLPDENIIIRSDESIMMNDPKYFEVPLRISTKMNELSAVGLELSYPSDKFKLVSASMSNTGKKSGAIKINPTLEEIIAANNDLLVTDDQGIIRVVYATTDYFDIAANVELVRLGFLALSDPGRGELDFDLNGTGLIANQYGEINSDAYLTMPKIFVQGNNTEAGFEFAGYPNPFSGSATLTYNLPENGTVKLNVYNAIGELVSELVNETQISGKHEVVFSQKDLSAGMYTFKLEFSGLNESKNMLLKMIH